MPDNHLDVRDLPHPQPLLTILEATTRLAPGETLHVTHNRIPHLLYPRLAERGLQCITEQTGAELVQLRITRPGESAS
ncbi:MAG: DUF2249 domain-containing protein [Magnetococcales bacterium]|nr:DUF2249 domain-containing protein [Magnetococcales bacterium]